MYGLAMNKVEQQGDKEYVPKIRLMFLWFIPTPWFKTYAEMILAPIDTYYFKPISFKTEQEAWDYIRKN
jgi:hypothetical protein